MKKLEKFVAKDAIITATKEVQALTDKYLDELDRLSKAKEKELMAPS